MAAFTFKGILWRFLFALAMVCLTWNPTRYNYVEWAKVQWEAQGPLVVFSGLVMLAGWIVFLRATARSLGFIGIVLGVALAGTVLWTLFFYDLITTESTEVLSWIVLVLLSVILAMGMSWSHLRRRWAGQHDVDDIDE